MRMKERFHKYVYDGPVMIFNQYVGTWHGETIAQSRAKAKSNLVCQCKKALNKKVDAGGVNILLEKIKMVS